jgi:hypothetical protein
MNFKPITSSGLKTKPKESSLKPQTHAEIISSTSERIHIIYDDSGSMESEVKDENGNNKSCQELAAEATVDYLKNCKPHVTAVNIAPLCTEEISLTKNLPLVATQIKAIRPTGGTPLFRSLQKLVSRQGFDKFTRALIFTDGGATDPSVLYDDPNLLAKVKELDIPIDFIFISDAPYLQGSSQQIKDLAESTGGVFLHCKDGKTFKEKMKFFAPLLRHLLPSIASKDDRG